MVVPVAGYLRAQIDAGEVLDKVLKAHPKDAVVSIHDVEPFLVLPTQGRVREWKIWKKGWRRRLDLSGGTLICCVHRGDLSDQSPSHSFSPHGFLEAGVTSALGEGVQGSEEKERQSST